jgi:MFS family permease
MTSNTSPSFWRQTKTLSWPFWAANIMETIERLAYYGIRVVIPIYIAQADEIAGLHFTQVEKGFIFMWWAIVQSALPVFTGGFADRYGYKRQIVVAIALKVCGYLLMATQTDFWPFFTGCMILAAGTAVFKPPIQGTFVKTLTEESSGVGWGFFYMVVNVGGFLGPPLAHFLYGYSWPHVFYGCAVLVSLNLLMLLTYGNVESGSEHTGGMWRVVVETGKNFLNWRLIAFILIMSVFWASASQFFDMLPNFIVDWTDSAAIAQYLPAFMRSTNIQRGPQIAQEWVINLNPFLIILFVAPLSWLVNHYMRRLTSMLLGFIVSAVGTYLVGYSMGIGICILGIALFSVGEMLCSPKLNEYLGVIAPSDKKALYMGYANIPFAIGWGYGSFVAGNLYDSMGEKAGLALRHLEENLHVVELPSRMDAFSHLCELIGKSPTDTTTLLWETYHPGQVWTPFVIAALVSAGALWVFNYLAKKRAWVDTNV